MEANIVVKAEDLTPDFADGICKVFSKSAMLHIKIEYNLTSEPAPAGKNVVQNLKDRLHRQQQVKNEAENLRLKNKKHRYQKNAGLSLK